MALPAKVAAHVVSALLAFLVFAPMILFVIDREPPTLRMRGMVEPPEVRGGDEIHVTWQIKGGRVCEGAVTRSIIDASGIVWTFQTVDATAAHDDRYILRVDLAVPKQAAPGPAKYRSVVHWACNPLHKLWPIVVVHPMLPFTILPP